MRLKNVRNANDIISNSSYVIKNPTDYKGKWNLLFNNDNLISIEIGMGKGDFIIGMAKLYPNINFIGIEMYDSVLVRAVQKLDNEDFIDNLKLIRMDANNINEVFEKEIDIIYLNFSDPWPKERHAKRRLTSHVFLSKYDSIFKDDKKIIQKTDNTDLFSFSIESLISYGYEIENVTRDLLNENIKENVETEYEKKFNGMGKKICRLQAHKR